GEYTAPQQSEYTAPQQGAYNAPVETKANNTLGIISLICGIVSVVSTCCCGWISFPTAIAGIVCAIIDKNKNGNMTTMAKVGLILGIVGIVLAIVNIILSVVLGGISGMMSALSELSNSPSYYYY
ncbi:MAG: DUF4190 domain-containing protein, partial [Eubacteriales bacterium]|nr:DUF4190 domain-containing protein [Eubacteriales bacterium]